MSPVAERLCTGNHAALLAAPCSFTPSRVQTHTQIRMFNSCSRCVWEDSDTAVDLLEHLIWENRMERVPGTRSPEQMISGKRWFPPARRCLPIRLLFKPRCFPRRCESSSFLSHAKSTEITKLLSLFLQSCRFSPLWLFLNLQTLSAHWDRLQVLRLRLQWVSAVLPLTWRSSVRCSRWRTGFRVRVAVAN